MDQVQCLSLSGDQKLVTALVQSAIYELRVRVYLEILFPFRCLKLEKFKFQK